MKQVLLLFILIATSLVAKAEGIEFFHGTWEEAKQKALEEERILFVDAYTSWCGPCKMMSKKVFPDKAVGEFFNENFIAVKLDMEKTEKGGTSFAREYRVRSYPSLFFIDGAGEVVHMAVGAKQAPDLIALGKTVLKKLDKSADYAQEYEKGNREPEFMYKYIKSLNQAGKPSLKVANSYIKTQKDLSTPANVKFLFAATQESDSRIFNLMVKQKKEVVKMFGQEAFDKKVIVATNKTIDKAVEYESLDLLEEAKEKINVISDKERAKLFHARADKKFYLLTGRTKEYVKSAKKYVKTIAGKDPELMEQLGMEVKTYLSTDKKALKHGETWAKMAYEKVPTAKRGLLYAHFAYTNGNYAVAEKVAEKAIELAKDEKQNPREIKALLQRIRIALSK